MMALFFFRPELYTQALPHHAHGLSITVPHRGSGGIWQLPTQPPHPPSQPTTGEGSHTWGHMNGVLR